MPSLADDRAAYLEASRRAEEAAGITRDPEGNEVYDAEQTPVATPELEGAVPITASDQPLTPEPVTPVTPVETDTSEQQPVAPAEPVAPLTPEQLQERLAVAEARLEEKDSFIGRQSGEVGELRQAIAEMQTQLAKVQTAPVAAIPITQDLIDSNPGAAVQAAFDQKDERALQIAFEAWKDPITGDPFAAAAWLNDRKLEQQQIAFDAKLAETRQQFETATAPLVATSEESATQREWAEAFNEVKATRPDFMENAARLLEEVAPQHPFLLPALQSGDAKAKAGALSALYALDKLGNPGAVQAQLETAAGEAAAEAAEALRAAGAVNGQTTAGQSTELKTEDELEREGYIARQRSKPSLSKGWTGRT
jgi:hypothetical protein